MKVWCLKDIEKFSRVFFSSAPKYHFWQVNLQCIIQLCTKLYWWFSSFVTGSLRSHPSPFCKDAPRLTTSLYNILYYTIKVPLLLLLLHILLLWQLVCFKTGSLLSHPVAALERTHCNCNLTIQHLKYHHMISVSPQNMKSQVYYYL